MSHQQSFDDRAFREQFETCLTSPADFNHQAHIRLAYIYLCDDEPSKAYQNMRQSLQGFLTYYGVEASKYHETLTRAWLKAIHHFMVLTSDTSSAAAFIVRHPQLLDAKVMLTHYSKASLFSDRARATFVEPDLEPIPD